MWLFFFLAAFCGCWSTFAGEAFPAHEPVSGIYAGSNGLGKQAMMRNQNANPLTLIAGNRSSRNSQSSYLNQLLSRLLHVLFDNEISVLRRFGPANCFHEPHASKFLDDLLSCRIIVRAGPFC